MGKLLHVVLLILVSVPLSTAQRPVTVDVPDSNLAGLAESIERQSDVKIIFLDSGAATHPVSVSAVDENPLSVIQTALTGTEYEASLYRNRIYITRNARLVTSLAFDDTRSMAADFPYFLRTDSRYSAAASQNKLYEIGDPYIYISGALQLRGVVNDFKTGDPLAATTVKVPALGVAATTDRGGNYTLTLPRGRHELVVESVGRNPSRRQIALYSSGSLDIEMEGQVYEIEDITVTSSRLDNVRSTIMGMERINMNDVRHMPTAFGEADVLSIVMSLPGVKSAGEASSGFNVRGGATDQNLILFNNGTIYNPNHLFGFFSAFNPDIVSSLELYKSSIPTRYGGRISSVLDIESNTGSFEKIKGSASLGLLTSRAALEGPILKDKLSFLVSGRTTYSDWILRQLPEDSGYSDGNAGFYDLNAILSGRISERDNITASGYFSRDRFRFNKQERYSYRNANTSVKWTHVYNPDLYMSLTAGYDRYDQTTSDVSYEPGGYRFTAGIEQYFGRVDFSWDVHEKHSLELGASVIDYNTNPGKYLPDGLLSQVEADRLQREKALESALYAGYKWDITDALSIDAGIRYSIFNVLGPRSYNIYQDGTLPSYATLRERKETGSGVVKTYQGPEFRVALRYEFIEGFSVKAGYNTLRQYIHKLSNNTVMSPTDTWKLSDYNIKPQTGSQAALGLYKNLAANTIEVSIEGYYKTMDDYLDYRPGAQLVMNHNIETDVLPSEGRAYGVELMVKKMTGRLSGWMSYTYSKVEIRQNDKRITAPVNGGEWYPAEFDKPHEFKFAGNYAFTKRLSVSLNVDYSTGKPVTVPVSKYIYDDREYVYYSERNGYRVKDYFRMDFSFNIEPKHRQTQKTHSSFTVGLYNVTGRKNIYSVYYVQEEGRLQGYRMAIFGTPIPYASYNIKF